MASLDNLPMELACRITKFLSDRRFDLANCRLVGSRLGEAATRTYFERIPLYAQFWDGEEPTWMPNNIVYDTQYFLNILDSDHLKKMVKKVDIYTCNPDCNHNPAWASLWGHSLAVPEWNSEMASDQLTDGWYECFERLPELERLHSVSVIFDRWGGGASSCIDTDDIFQTTYTRSKWTEKVCELLGDRIKHLSLRHFDDGWSGNDDFSGTDLGGVLRGLESLRMSCVTEQVSGDGDHILKGADGGHFNYVWAQFPSRWLAPAQNLTQLVLYCDLPIGWYPKLDLRGVHFPKLQSLTFGQLMFSHDWQIDWIISHNLTLRVLNLDHCSILYQFGFSHPYWLTDDGYPGRENPDPNKRDDLISLSPDYEDEPGDYEKWLTFVPYSTRWHDVFARFQSSLSNLKVFRFGSSSQWDFSWSNKRGDREGIRPTTPWESETDIKNDLFDNRYLVYNDWSHDFGANWKETVEYEDDIHPLMEEPPACSEEDMRALQELLQAVKKN